MIKINKNILKYANVEELIFNLEKITKNNDTVFKGKSFILRNYLFNKARKNLKLFIELMFN